ncbi:unnamed protein product [Peronospora belbahrii]|uniref:Uncharacterized protein n=1 Tax=Peronospora belbahrii TaxID=622444 RepID=A0AAU9KSG4_9STRA|nr:unnamed protein product [Peronospora belbahrii]
MAMVETRLSKKIPSFSGRTSGDDPSFSGEDDEVDETFVALQKMLKTLNRTNRVRHSSFGSNNGSFNSNSGSNNGSFLSGSGNAMVLPVNDSANQQSMSREEMLESRRQERDRFRRSLFARNNSSSNDYSARLRQTCPAYYYSEEEEEDETREPSVESTISNRLMNGSFSNLNVHVISRSRWSAEDRAKERLPIVMLPKNGKFSIPTDNKKINVVQTDEFIELHDKLIKNLPPRAATMHYLTPPRSTWYMQMHDFEELKW